MTYLEVLLHRNGPALWPDYVTLDDLADARRELGTPIFNTMYQAMRGGLAGTIVKREWFLYGTFDQDDPTALTFMTIDPAISKSTQADETAVAVGTVVVPRREREAVLYLRWVWHGRASAFETADVIQKAWEYYAPASIGIEAVAYQAALIEIVGNKYPHLPLEAIVTDRDKVSRFYGLGALYEFGRIVHHPSLANSAYEYQVTHVPAGKHDDMADAATMLAEMAGMTHGATAAQRPPGML